MKRIRNRRSRSRKLNGGVFVWAIMLGLIMIITPVINRYTGFFAAAFTGMTLPEGGKELLFRQIYGNPVSVTEPKNNAGNSNDLPDIFQPSSSGDIGYSGGGVPHIELGDIPDIEEGNIASILNMTIGNTGSNYGNIWLKNSTGREISIKNLLNSSPDISQFKRGNTKDPVVLIYHTHSTEAFLDYDGEYYDKQWSGRSNDNQQNIIAVGEVIAEQLRSAGVGVVHDTTIYDSPAYSGAYKRSGASIDRYLQKYPSIQVALDIHRDSMTRDDGTKIRPTVEINGRKAAQIMIIAGCENESSLSHPDWEYNLIFALNLQNIIESKYQGLSRPLNFMVAQYNQQRSHNGLLIEVGTEVNTVNEALYSGYLVGDCLAELLKQYSQ